MRAAGSAGLWVGTRGFFPERGKSARGAGAYRPMRMNGAQ